MPERVRKAVSLPGQLLWAPQELALMNMVLHSGMMGFNIALFDVTPLLFIASMVLMHIFLVSVAAKEPHITDVIRAWAFSKQHKTKNLIQGKGNKYVP